MILKYNSKIHFNFAVIQNEGLALLLRTPTSVNIFKTTNCDFLMEALFVSVFVECKAAVLSLSNEYAVNAMKRHSKYAASYPIYKNHFPSKSSAVYNSLRIRCI